MQKKYLQKRMKAKSSLIVVFSFLFIFSLSAYSGSRIIATGGAQQVEGSAGGGIVPWAVITGYGQEGEWNVNGFATHLMLDEYDFSAAGFNIGIHNRFEISYAQQHLDISNLADALNLPDNTLKMETFGVKTRLFNHLIYDKWPQVSVGFQYKKNLDFDVPSLIAAKDDNGIDYYISASKLFLSGIAGYPILVNGTLRNSNANQLGLLGFGGDGNDNREWLFETSAAILFGRNVAVGFEYRQKPDNINFAKEEDWSDIFIAWFPTKHLSLTAAYADLGNIAANPNQQGFYISLQGSL